jgi:hypothetical protein
MERFNIEMDVFLVDMDGNFLNTNFRRLIWK